MLVPKINLSLTSSLLCASPSSSYQQQHAIQNFITQTGSHRPNDVRILGPWCLLDDSPEAKWLETHADHCKMTTGSTRDYLDVRRSTDGVECSDCPSRISYGSHGDDTGPCWRRFLTCFGLYTSALRSFCSHLASSYTHCLQPRPLTQRSLEFY